MAYTTDMSTIPAFYNKMFNERLVPAIAAYDVATKRPLPENSGTTMYFPQMSSSFATVSAYKSTAGTVVTPEAANDFRVSAVIEKYRNAKGIWDLAKLTGLSTYIDEVVAEQADHAAQIIDKRILEECYGSSAFPVNQKFSAYAYDNTGAVDLMASYTVLGLSGIFGLTSNKFKLTTASIRGAAGKLRARNVKPFDDGYYHMLLHTDSEMALQADTTWAASHAYGDAENMRKGIFGDYAGVKFHRDNNIYTSALGVSSLTAYASVLLGKGALAVSELGGGIQTFLKEGGPQDTSNPVNEFVTFGWKVMFVPKALNLSAGLIVLSADA